MVAVARSSNEQSSSRTSSTTLSKQYILRNGKPREADSVFDAWTSGDLPAMMAQLDQKTTLVDRLFVLMNIVDGTYRHRNDPKMRAACHKVAKIHIEEFPKIKPALTRFLGVLPRVATFQQYATVLTEEQRFKEVIAVCESALKFALSDGRKGDFEGRIERIKKRQRKPQKESGLE